MASESSESQSPMRIRRSTFQFEIDHSKTENLPIGEYISSPIFTAGGYDWTLSYYPQGYLPEKQGSHVSVYLLLESKVEDVSVEYSFEVLGKQGRLVTMYNPRIENFANNEEIRGFATFIARDTIKKYSWLNDVLVISCNITVLTEPRVVQPYPGGLCEHIERLWEKGQRFDVTFEVEGESISAHRFMLAARSPVFEAKLYGPMAEANMEHIKIDEMRAEVFMALLHFVYTDQLVEDGSSTDHQDLSVELLQDLFVAADRFALDKLSLLCREQLERNLSVDTVATTLVLADRHSCAELKKKCLDFASAPENFSLVALTVGYLHIMQGASLLFSELSEKVKRSSHSAKRERL